MDNAQKAIMIGVGLFITIIIISAVLLIVNLGTDLVGDSTDQLDSISSSLQGRLTEQYDGKTMSGARVLSAIKEYQNSSSLCIVLCKKDPDLTKNEIIARTGAKAVISIDGQIGKTGDDNVKTTVEVKEWEGTEGDNTYKTPISDFSSTTKTCAINQSKQYNASLIKTDNGTVIGIAFKPVND